MLTDSPNSSYSSYSCNICGISTQVLVPTFDSDGNQVYTDDWQPVLHNDEEAAMVELEEHQEEHTDQE